MAGKMFRDLFGRERDGQRCEGLCDRGKDQIDEAWEGIKDVWKDRTLNSYSPHYRNNQDMVAEGDDEEASDDYDDDALDDMDEFNVGDKDQLNTLHGQLIKFIKYCEQYLIPTFKESYNREARAAAWPSSQSDVVVFDSTSNAVEGSNGLLNKLFRTDKATVSEAIARTANLLKARQWEREQAALGARNELELNPSFFKKFGMGRAEASLSSEAAKMAHLRKLWPKQSRPTVIDPSFTIPPDSTPTRSPPASPTLASLPPSPTQSPTLSSHPTSPTSSAPPSPTPRPPPSPALPFSALVLRPANIPGSFINLFHSNGLLKHGN